MPLSLSIGPRKIKNGRHLDGFFPSEDEAYTNDHTLANGDVQKTVELMASLAKSEASDTARIAPKLKGNSRAETVQNVHRFMVDFLQYDTERGEKLRTPRRTWHVGSRQIDHNTGDHGVDCDDMTLFAATVFRNLQIPYFFRIVKIQNNDFQHVYLLVPVQGNDLNNGYYTVDGVIAEFNREHPFKYQETFNQNGMKIEYLGSLQGDGKALSVQALTPAEVQQVMVLLRAKIAEFRDKVKASGIIDPDTALVMLDRAIATFQTAGPAAQQAMIVRFAQLENSRRSRINLFRQLAVLLGVQGLAGCGCGLSGDNDFTPGDDEVLIYSNKNGVETFYEDPFTSATTNPSSGGFLNNLWGSLEKIATKVADNFINGGSQQQQQQQQQQITPTSIPNTQIATNQQTPQNDGPDSTIMWVAGIGVVVTIAGLLIWSGRDSSKANAPQNTPQTPQQ